MTEQKQFPPKLLKGKLYQKTTKDGQTFFIGTDGYLKTLVFKATPKEGEEDNVWLTYVVPRSEEEIAQRQTQNAAKYGNTASNVGHTHTVTGHAAGTLQNSAPPAPAHRTQGPDDWIPF